MTLKTTYRRRDAGVLVKWTEDKIRQLEKLICEQGMTHSAAGKVMGLTKNQVTSQCQRMGFRAPLTSTVAFAKRKTTLGSRQRVKIQGDIHRELQDREKFDPAIAARAQRNAVHERLGGCQWLPPDEPSVYRNFCHADTVPGTVWCQNHIAKVYIHGKHPSNKQTASSVDPLRRSALGKRFSST